MFTTRKKVHPYKKEIKSRIILNKEKRIILAMNEFQKLSDVKVNDLSKFPWWPGRSGAIFDTATEEGNKASLHEAIVALPTWPARRGLLTVTTLRAANDQSKNIAHHINKSSSMGAHSEPIIDSNINRHFHAIFDTVLNCYKLKKQISRRKYEIKKGVHGQNGYSIQKLFETKVTIGRRRPGRCASHPSPFAIKRFAGYKQPSLGATRATWGHLFLNKGFRPPSVSVKEDYFFKGFRKSKIPLKLINLFFKEMDNMVDFSTFAGKNKNTIEPISLRTPESPLVSRIISFMKFNYLRSAQNLGSSLSEANEGTEGGAFAPSSIRSPSLALGVEEIKRKGKNQKKVASKIKKILNFFILYQTIQKSLAMVTTSLNGRAPEWDQLNEIGGKLIPLTTFLMAKRIGEGTSHSHHYRNKNVILISKEKMEMSNDEIKTGAQIEPFPYNPNLRITKELLNQIIILPPYKFEKLQEGEKISALYGDLEKNSQSALAGGYPRALAGVTHGTIDESLRFADNIPRKRKGYKMGVSLKITPDKIGYKLGEFLKTRKDPIIKIKKKN